MDSEQKHEIELAKRSGLDIKFMTYTEFRDCWQLEQIRLGLEHNIDVSPYSKPVYTWAQMREIRIGIEKNLNISKYLNSDFSYNQMQMIRKGLESGIDVSNYANPNISTVEMEEIYNKLCQNR